MRKLSLVLLSLVAMLCLPAISMADSPHGKGFNLNCDLCHSPDSWKLDKKIYAFDHNKTVFPLNGQHQAVDCRACHPTLVFSDAKTSCAGCHTDMHNQTVGPDCGRCHTTKSWIVENITELHQRGRFPLLGAHRTADCSGCHKSASLLRFEPLGIQCYDCHQANYLAATNPNHVQGGFSKDCIQCHAINSISWSSTNVNHSFFPLTQGHALNCTSCHKNGTFTGLSRECDNCHQANYAATSNPNHPAAHIPITCADCHTTVPGWKPASFTIHNTYYALNGAHTTVDCNQCHNGNYATTPNTCVGCHQNSYNSTTNPNHQAASIPKSCADCHTTNPSWKPATFTIHNTYYPLTGTHATINCDQCHNGIYNNTTPTTCVGCHLTNYNQTNNPPHAAAQFGTDCQTCHSTTAWTPATFDHDGKYFPIYSGKHQGTWTLCTDCHTTASNYGTFSCIDCHAHNNQTQLNNDHQGVGGYTYTSIACYSCHPTGSVNGAFNHNNGGFPLTGAHLTVPCTACHTNGFPGTPTACAACHITAYNQTTNPNHITANIPNTCATCHTTNPGWTPATFPTHNNYYALTGAHATITNCDQCHNGNYNTTPNTCVGCHQNNYNQTNNPNHTTIGISNNCVTCHTTNPGWSPATFPTHNNYYALTGAHTNITNCDNCHNGNYNTTPNTCVGCHQNNYNQTNNPNHTTLGISNDCASCHTTNPGWIPALFTIHNNYWPLTGFHATITNCDLCHSGNYNTAPTTCVGCHLNDYNQTTNPPHASAQFPTDCQSCHTTTAWSPSTFNHDQQYFPIYSGHHAGRWTLCADCHTNASNYQIFSCIDCHAHNNQNQVNNDHQGVSGYSYNSVACYNCHPTGSSGGKFPKMRLDNNINNRQN